MKSCPVCGGELPLRFQNSLLAGTSGRLTASEACVGQNREGEVKRLLGRGLTLDEVNFRLDYYDRHGPDCVEESPAADLWDEQERI